MTSSSTSQTCGRARSTIRFADLMFCAYSRSTSRFITKGLKQLERHLLGQTALAQLELRTDDDHRTAGVVDALAEQVLAEPALLALQHVRERLQRAVARARDGPAPAAVVEQCVDGLLEHPLLVVDDDLGRTEVEEALQPVVAVDHPAVEVVQVRGGEAATVELDHRAEVRRDHRHRVEDHAHRAVDLVAVVVAAVERRDHLEALDRLGLALALGGRDDLLEDLLFRRLEVEAAPMRPLTASAPMPPSK